MTNTPRVDQFGFTIVDDTDLSTLENVKPVYDLLASLGIRTTKTVWPLRCEDMSNRYAMSSTLADENYALWVKDLQSGGFEIAFHGASAGSNSRETTRRGLDVFNSVLGRMPTMHVNHHRNLDNLYWGLLRFDLPVVKCAVGIASRNRDLRFEGHKPGSPYFWGDICEKIIRYSRNLTFKDRIDLKEVNPTLPYADPRRPFVQRWFSACDGGDPARFVRLLRPVNLQKLVDRRGVCIVYTHFGAGFVINGKVRPDVEVALRNVASLPGGRFVPASDLLDELADINPTNQIARLDPAERRRMELVWLWEKIRSGGTS